MAVELITSQTNSVWANRTSHAVKVSLSTVIATAFLSRFPPGKNVLVGTLGLSAVAFPAFHYAYEGMAWAKPDHDPKPYNFILNHIWGAPAKTRARIQFPLVTGVQLVLLFRFLRSSPLWIKLGAFAAATYPQGQALWRVLSLPPELVDDGKWMQPKAIKEKLATRVK